MKKEIAIVGISCVYPGASNYTEFWDNIRAGRKAFRKMPEVRLNKNYFSDDVDGIYQEHAAVLDNYQFDRVQYKIPENTYRSTDISHWIALDVATQALIDAGIVLGKESDAHLFSDTGVYVGNTLTGEMTRAHTLRQRWPYVHNVLLEQLKETDWDEQTKKEFILKLESRYKSAFPEMMEDSLAGGLSNTIAGRICNYHDFNGGGYTVDAACGSSLLAIATACKAIEAGEVTMALAGGVDISLDPFELVGFSRTGALAKDKMNVYAENSNGFWPGEGCGFVVLMEADEARKQGNTIYGYINGHGISSDGKGGITRPKASMQKKAILSAYPDESLKLLKYIEGHGTGTSIGDSTELIALHEIAQISGTKVMLGAVKELIGHTKAAAGIAGFIKTLLVNYYRTIPVQHNYEKQNKILKDSEHLFLSQEELRIDASHFVTGVSAFGFGGINVHVSVLNNQKIQKESAQKCSVYQGSELFLFNGTTRTNLRIQVKEILEIALELSVGELTDLSNYLLEKVEDSVLERLAVVASSPEELDEKLRSWIEQSDLESGSDKGFFWSNKQEIKRIGYLFPGQGVTDQINSSFLKNRFPFLEKVIETFGDFSEDSDITDTSIAQPYIVRNSCLGLMILNSFKVSAQVGIGHSLGEITGLFWSDSLKLKAVSELTKKRGELMRDFGNYEGRMYSIASSDETIEELITGFDINISCINSNKQTIVSGLEKELISFGAKLKEHKISFLSLPVKRAFHSPLMESAIEPYQQIVEQFEFDSPKNVLFSPTTSGIVSRANEIGQMLTDQLTLPVHFRETFKQADEEVDLWIEVGSGNSLKKMTRTITKTPVMSTKLGNNLDGILEVIGMMFVHQHDLSLNKLMEDRLVYPFDPNKKHQFIENPCESIGNVHTLLKDVKNESGEIKPIIPSQSLENLSSIDTLKQTVASKTGLPYEAISNEARMLDDLHLNSIVVGNIVSEVASQLDHTNSITPSEYANASIQEIADSFTITNTDSYRENTRQQPEQVWVGRFKLEWLPIPLPTTNDRPPIESGNWKILGINPENLNLPGSGTLISFHGLSDEEYLELLTQFVSNSSKQTLACLLVVDDLPRSGGWTKSFALEHQETDILVIESSEDIDTLVPKIGTELNVESTAYRYVKWTEEQRYESYITNHQLDKLGNFELAKDDLVLVSGGGKGITAECALSLAGKYKNKTVLVGRSAINHPKVQTNLKRFEQMGLSCYYYSCDITNSLTIEQVVNSIRNEHGAIKVLLHGAGKNTPCSFNQLTMKSILDTLAPKLGGLRNLLGVLDDTLDKVVTFGSIIARSGMEGNADYALANEWMANEHENWSNNKVRSWLNIEWSVWSGTGMGDELGVLEQLRSKGIQPINIENGIAHFLELVQSNTQGNVIVAARYGQLSTLSSNPVEYSNYRFLENVQNYYPGKEIDSTFHLDLNIDHYLNDHVINNVPVMPTVLWVEAMAQAAAVLWRKTKGSWTFNNVQLKRPGLVSEKGLDVHLHALENNGEIEIKLSNERKELFLTADVLLNHEATVFPDWNQPVFSKPPLTAKEAIYDDLLFHTGRFTCIESILFVSPYEIYAKVNIEPVLWFNLDSDSNLITPFPQVFDAMLHLVQACVPHYTLLPVSIEQFWMSESISNDAASTCFIHAKENYRKGDIFEYSIVLYNQHREILAVYTNVQFNIVKEKSSSKCIAPELLEVSLTRMLEEVGFNGVSIRINEVMEYLHRPDGKPISLDGFVSKSEISGLYLNVSREFNIGCDIEEIRYQRESKWIALLGEEDVELARGLKSDLNIVCTMIWSVRESLRKMGVITPTKLKISPTEYHNAYLVETDQAKVFTWCGIRIGKKEIVCSIALENVTSTKSFKDALVVSFEETNLVGNVYFSNYVRWQGKCREAFLRQNVMQISNSNGELVPITKMLSDGRLALVTCSTNCKYLRELRAFDEVSIHLTLDYIRDNRIGMSFSYRKLENDEELIVAEGNQEVACMERTSDGGVQTYREVIPSEFKRALVPYIRQG